MNKWKEIGFILTIFPAIFLFPVEAFSQSPEQQTRFNKKVNSLLKYSIPVITVQLLKKKLSENTALVILDTRESEEYDVSHIKSARCVGYSDFKISVLRDIPKDTPIIVYCSLGVRSEKIGEKIRSAGYSNVKNLLGGIFQWVHQDYPVYDNEGNPTLRVHAYSKKWGKWLFKGEKTYR